MNIIENIEQIDSSCFNGTYRELAELIGWEQTLLIHSRFAGQYVTFPKKLYADSYIHKQIMLEYDGKNANELAKKYGYTYSWIMKLIKKMKEGDGEE